MVIPITSDPSVAIDVAVLLDNPVVSAMMSYELRFYIVFLACAILLSDFGTTPIRKEINNDTTYFNQILQVHTILLVRHAEITCTLASVSWIRTASSSRKKTSG